MNGADRITCNGCGREVVPRLWHYGGGRLTYMKTQHLCPFCGVVMYETGGGMQRGCREALLIFALLFIALFVLILFLQLRRDFSR